MLVDANLIKDGEDDDEEVMRWRSAAALEARARRRPGGLDA